MWSQREVFNREKQSLEPSSIRITYRKIFSSFFQHNLLLILWFLSLKKALLEMGLLWIPKELLGSDFFFFFSGLNWRTNNNKKATDNGYAMGHDSLDGEDGLDRSGWLGFFLLDRCWRGCRFSKNRRYWPFSCWLILPSNSHQPKMALVCLSTTNYLFFYYVKSLCSYYL